MEMITSAAKKMIHQQVQLILVGPLIEESPLEFEFLQKNPTIMAIGIDRGADHLPASHLHKYSVGDGDSSQNSIMDAKLPQKKDYTDLEYALGLVSILTRRLYLLGFEGGRLDHQLGVFGALNHFLSRNLNIECYLGAHFKVQGPGQFSENLHGLFSLLVLQSGHVSISGQCQYHLSGQESLSVLSGRGLSNSGQGLVEIESDVPYLLWSQRPFMLFL